MKEGQREGAGERDGCSEFLLRKHMVQGERERERDARRGRERETLQTSGSERPWLRVTRPSYLHIVAFLAEGWRQGQKD